MPAPTGGLVWAEPEEPKFPASEILELLPTDNRQSYDVREVLYRLVDGSRFQEFKPEYGCYFRLSHKADDEGTVVSGVLNRSPYVGVPIEQSPGITRLDAWGEPAYPTIPEVTDGEWHRLRLSVDGRVVRIWLDDRLIAAAQDHYLEAGTVGLFTRRQDIEWRNFSVWDAPW